jgi:hypothetical protein
MNTAGFSTHIAKADLMRTQLRVFLQPAPLLKGLVLWTVIVAAVLIFWFGPKKAFSNLPVLFLSAFGGAIGSCAVVLLSELARLWLFSDRVPGLLGTHHFELRDDGLFEKTESNETLSKWASIVDIQSGEDWINVEIQPGMFYYIPPGTFPDAAQFAAMAEELRRRVAVAKAG